MMASKIFREILHNALLHRRHLLQSCMARQKTAADVPARPCLFGSEGIIVEPAEVVPGVPHEWVALKCLDEHCLRRLNLAKFLQRFGLLEIEKMRTGKAVASDAFTAERKLDFQGDRIREGFKDGKNQSTLEAGVSNAPRKRCFRSGIRCDAHWIRLQRSSITSSQ